MEDGTWTVIHDGGAAGTVWSRLSWSSAELDGSSLTVYARVAETQGGLPAVDWDPVEWGAGHLIHGRYIEIRVEFNLGPDSQVSPILFDLSASTADVQGGTSDDEQSPIAVSTECDGDTGMLVVPAGWPVRETIESYRVVHAFESGHRWRGSRALRQRRAWEIEARAVTIATISILRDFFDDHLGVEVPFFWTTPPPTSETVTVRFADDALEDALRAPGVAGFSFGLEEAIC